jgi:hypothetical protein
MTYLSRMKCDSLPCLPCEMSFGLSHRGEIIILRNTLGFLFWRTPGLLQTTITTISSGLLHRGRSYLSKIYPVRCDSLPRGIPVIISWWHFYYPIGASHQGYFIGVDSPIPAIACPRPRSGSGNPLYLARRLSRSGGVSRRVSFRV